MVRRPEVPPYSSTTMAMWVFRLCIVPEEHIGGHRLRHKVGRPQQLPQGLGDSFRLLRK